MNAPVNGNAEAAPWTYAETRMRTCGRVISLATDKLAALSAISEGLAGDVRAGYLNGQEVADRLHEVADAYGLLAKHGADIVQATIGAGLERASAPLDAAWASRPPERGNGKTGAPPPYDWREHVTTAAQLQREKFPPVSWVVPGLIPEGLSIIAGRPKIGKSWLALDVCIAIASGRFCLGERKPTPGDVLYAALEDNPRRLQRRIDKLLSPVSTEWPERLTLATTWRRLDKGGVDDVQKWIESVPEPRLVVLDTLAGVRPIRTNNGYTEDYESLAALHRLANQKGIGTPVLHHTRKMEADDPLDTVSGTLGLAGCADTVLVISRSSQGTTLYVRGRDIEEAEHAISFDKHSCRWTILGDAAEVQRSDIRRAVLRVLKENGEPMTPAQIGAALDEDRNTIKQRVYQMYKDGDVEKAGEGRYRHPETAAPRDLP